MLRESKIKRMANNGIKGDGKKTAAPYAGRYVSRNENVEGGDSDGNETATIL